jgi:uncharacterized protein (DUF58 family)
MIPRDLLKKIRRIQIHTNRIVKDLFAGQYHSAFKGLGMEFEEVRPYQIGDDVRSIDWNVSARYGEPFVKRFREERELTVMLLVDMSGSQLFGTSGQLKRDLAAEICATLAFSAITNNDKVGLLGFTDEVELVVPPRKGPRHVLRVIREVLYHRPRRPGTNVSAALEYLSRITRRRAVVFVISDFLADGFEPAFRIASRRHDVIPVVVADRHESTLPNVGLLELTDAETGRRTVIDTASRPVRARFEEFVNHRREKRTRIFRRMSIDTIDVHTGASFVEPLTRFFRMRGKRK